MDNFLDCNRFEERLQSLMDQHVGLASDTQVQNHAKGCECCGKLLNDFLALEKTLGKVFSPNANDRIFGVDASGDVQVGSSARSHSLGLSTKRSRATHWMMTGSAMAAAAILLLLVPNWMVGDRSVADEGSDVVVASLDTEPSATELVIEPGAQLSAQENMQYRSGMVQTLPVPLRSVYGYAAELPGVRPFECSVNVTIEMLQRSFGRFAGEKQVEEDPDLGHFLYNGQQRMA